MESQTKEKTEFPKNPDLKEETKFPKNSDVKTEFSTPLLPEPLSNKFDPFVNDDFEIRKFTRNRRGRRADSYESLRRRYRSPYKTHKTVTFNTPTKVVESDTERKNFTNLFNLRPYKSDTEKLVDAANGLQYALYVLAFAQIFNGAITFFSR